MKAEAWLSEWTAGTEFPPKAVSASADPVLALVPADRRRTLIAVREPGSGNAVYRLDIHLQGDNETVFFDV
jgi:protocatechuate 3,4-dioxygenase alpha subunit